MTSFNLTSCFHSNYSFAFFLRLPVSRYRTSHLDHNYLALISHLIIRPAPFNQKKFSDLQARHFLANWVLSYRGGGKSSGERHIPLTHLETLTLSSNVLFSFPPSSFSRTYIGLILLSLLGTLLWFFHTYPRLSSIFFHTLLSSHSFYPTRRNYRDYRAHHGRHQGRVC